MNRPLRIAHVDTERTWRGGENQVLLLMKGLRERGHTAVAVVRAGSALARRAAESGFSTHTVAPFGEWDFIAAHRFNRWLRRESIDLVHAHSAHAVALAAAGTLGTAIPLVVTRRVDFPLSSNPFSRWKYRRSSKIIAISHGVKDVLLKSGIPPTKVDVVPSGLDFRNHQTIQKVSRNDLGVPAEAIVVGQVAALAPHKDQATLVRAFSILHKQNPDLHLVFVGEGYLKAELQRLVNEQGLSAAVHFLGFKDQPLRYLACFDVFCLSSKEEGLGTSVLDAMALRIPVVATRVGGVPELVQDGVTGYLSAPQDPRALADKIQEALGMRSNNAALLERALARARDYDIRRTVLKTESVYFPLISR